MKKILSILSIILISFLAWFFFPRTKVNPIKEPTFGAAASTRQILKVFTADGTWVAPSGVTSAVVAAIGGGGGGTTNTGGGGGGAFASSSLNIVPGNSYPVHIGSASINVSADPTDFDLEGATASVSAAGGKSGTAGGAGGTTAASIGTTKNAGGSSSLGTGNQGGGGGAGPGTGGANGTGAVGGAGGDRFGGVGGLAATAPDFYGGGGGSVTGAGVAGARGVLWIKYSSVSFSGFPSVVDRAVSTNTSVTATSFVVNLPSNIVAGDLLVIAFSHTALTDSNANAGWIELASSSDTVGLTHFIYYKIAAGGDTATITSVTKSMSSAVAYRIQDGGTPQVAMANGGGSLGLPNPPNLAPSGGAQPYLWLTTMAADGTAPVKVSGWPTGFESGFQTGQRVNSGTVTAFADEYLNAASLNPVAFSSSLTNWVAATIAIPFSCESNCPTPTPTPGGKPRRAVIE